MLGWKIWATPALLFRRNYSIAADSCPGIDDQTNIAEQTGHLKSQSAGMEEQLQKFIFLHLRSWLLLSRGVTHVSIDSLKRLSKSTRILQSGCERPLTQKTIVWQSIIDFYRALIMSALVSRRGATHISCGSIRGFWKREAGWHTQTSSPSWPFDTRRNLSTSCIVY